MTTVDIILITCNRMKDSKMTIMELHSRLKTPFCLIVIDDNSIDGTKEMLEEMEKDGIIDVLDSTKNENICQSYNKGFTYVKSDYFICMQDDITVPDLEPCVIQQLISLMEKYPENASIGCRIQRIPNMDWAAGNEDIVPARKAASAYFRIHRKADVDKLGDKPFGNKTWDDLAWVSQVRNVLKMEASWAKNLWACHARGYCRNRGYNVVDRKWGWGKTVGSHDRNQEILRKPYPKVDPKTNIPLPGEKIYR